MVDCAEVFRRLLMDLEGVWKRFLCMLHLFGGFAASLRSLWGSTEVLHLVELASHGVFHEGMQPERSKQLEELPRFRFPEARSYSGSSRSTARSPQDQVAGEAPPNVRNPVLQVLNQRHSSFVQLAPAPRRRQKLLRLYSMLMFLAINSSK